MDTCANCQFWAVWPTQPDNKTGQAVNQMVGDCRRHAPALVPVIVQSGPVPLHVTAAQIKTKWPSTLTNWFCGEFQPHTEAKS